MSGSTNTCMVAIDNHKTKCGKPAVDERDPYLETHFPDDFIWCEEHERTLIEMHRAIDDEEEDEFDDGYWGDWE